MPADKKGDAEEVNPHIPKFIAQAPWYMDIGKPTLLHQTNVGANDSSSGTQWYTRGQKAAPAATKYRAGACENCGALSHKTKFCVERPRKLGAKWTNKDIQADELVQTVALGFEAKRDRWNGYDPAEYQKVVSDWEAAEEERKRIKESEVDELMKNNDAKTSEKIDLDELSSSDEEDDDNEDKYAEGTNMPGQEVDKKSRITIRNLRLREDTAKYLRNLDLNSAYYDPKTRSMRENPNDKSKRPDDTYSGDNFVRWTGDAPNMLKAQTFSWDAHTRGVDVNLQADPTRAEFLLREYEKKKVEVKANVKSTYLEKYGGEEHLQAPPKELLLAQTEHYVEYSKAGKVVKGLERVNIRSKYEEDNFEKYSAGHSSVWGSYFDPKLMRWGYKCCRSVFQKAYCTGLVNEDLEAPHTEVADEPKQQKSLKDQHLDKMIAEMKTEEEFRSLKRKAPAND